MGKPRNIKIKILPRRGGFFWNYTHANGRKANDIYTRARVCRTELKKFIAKIKKGEYEIE